jgi:hypothetical protein
MGMSKVGQKAYVVRGKYKGLRGKVSKLKATEKLTSTGWTSVERFFILLSNGKEIGPLDREMLDLLYDPSEIEEQIKVIQAKTSTSLNIPRDEIKEEEVKNISETFNKVQSGVYTLGNSRFPILVSKEDARNLLDRFGDRQAHQLEVPVEESVNILGKEIDLSPITLRCEKVEIAVEDLVKLKFDISSDNSEIVIHFTPVENCPVELRYKRFLSLATTPA